MFYKILMIILLIILGILTYRNRHEKLFWLDLILLIIGVIIVFT